MRNWSVCPYGAFAGPLAILPLRTLNGATAVGLTQHVGALRGLIQGRTRLGDWKQKLMETPTRFVEAFLACQRPNS